MINVDNMKQSYPKLMKEQCMFVKEDKSGNTILNSKLFPVVGQITLNKMSKFIISLCDGTHSVEDIVNTISEKYIVPSNVNIFDEVDMVLSKLYSICMIGFEQGNYILDRYQIINGDCTFKCLQYNDIVDFIDEMKSSKTYYNDAYRDFELFYSEDNLKASYSIGFENFFEISKNNQKLFTISVIPDGRICGYNIGVMSYKISEIDENVIDTLFRFIHSIYIDIVKLPSELFSDELVHFQLYTKQKVDELSDFEYIGELKKEIDGRSVYLYGRDIANQYLQN